MMCQIKDKIITLTSQTQSTFSPDGLIFNPIELRPNMKRTSLKPLILYYDAVCCQVVAKDSKYYFQNPKIKNKTNQSPPIVCQYQPVTFA